MVVKAVAVAAGAAQPQHLPIVDDRGFALGHQHRADQLAPVGSEARAAVLLEDRAMGAEPGRMAAAGGEAPLPGDPVAAIDGDALAGPGQFRPPGEDAARRPKDFAGDLGRQIGRGHRAAGILPEAPGRAAVALPEDFEDRGIGQGVELGAADRSRQQHPEDAALDQRLDDLRRHLAAALDRVAGGGEHRLQFARPVEIAPRQPASPAASVTSITSPPHAAPAGHCRRPHCALIVT